jgi:hypothetical protein
MDMDDHAPTDVDEEVKDTNPSPQKRQKTGTSSTITRFQLPSLV